MNPGKSQVSMEPIESLVSQFHFEKTEFKSDDKFLYYCFFLQQVFIYINQLCHPDTREKAIDELYKRRDVIPDLGVFLWHSFGKNSQISSELKSVERSNMLC